jgi:multiple sugar transport system permease protein
MVGLKKKWQSLLYHSVILILGIIMFYPILWLIVSSFKTHTEIFQNARSLIPRQFNFDNYIQGWKGFGNISFSTFFKNSFIITITATLGQVATAAAVAYGFARIKFVGKKFWFALMLSTMFLPEEVLMIPQYILFNNIGWTNTFKPLIIPRFLAMPFFVFLTYQFIQGIPIELDEAARIDGCGEYAIFFRIILPNIVPALITTFIFQFYWTWQDFLGPLLYIQSNNLYPVSLALKLFADPSSVTNWGAMFAMSVLSLLPSFILFLIFQRYLVEGISTTGLKN